MLIMQAMLKAERAQYLEDRRDRHKFQEYWRHTQEGEWQPTTTGTAHEPDINSMEQPINPKFIRLISWNIDFMAGYAEERMSAALQYLDKLVTSTPPEIPVVLFLQEMISSDLEQIRESEWVKKRFQVTDFDNQNWTGFMYGTTTLVDRRLTIKSVFRVPWFSGMERDGLFVDLVLSSTCDDTASILRLCNTHLESLPADPPVRPTQLADAARYLKDGDVACALLAGDLNAIQPFDRTLHTDNHLKDTYLELGGQEDTEDGYTWGPQAKKWSRERFGSCRMDKILFTGDLQPKSFGRIGMGVTVADDVLKEVQQENEVGYVTDHYGVMGDFELLGGWKLADGNGVGNEEMGSGSAKEA